MNYISGYDTAMIDILYLLQQYEGKVLDKEIFKQEINKLRVINKLREKVKG